MNFKFKTIIRFIVYFIINFLIRPSKKIEPKSLVLIRLDAIGDYILFRNFIETLKNSQKYKDYSITLIGNIVWKDLTEELDNKFIDKFIWLDRNSFSKNLIYRYRKLKEIVSTGYEIIINPIFSRTFFFDDNIVKLIHAQEKIGSIGNASNIEEWQKNISDKYYTKLIKNPKELMFEFYRNKFFFENLLDSKINIKRPNISLKKKKLGLKLSKKYAILFIGASDRYRKWSVKKFSKTGNYLKKKYGYNIVICGSNNEIDDANELKKYFDTNILNLAGKTTLLDLLFVISNADLILSNETSAPHIAVALNLKNIFVIYNGKHFGRFTPYPNEISKNYHALYHPLIERNLEEYKKISNQQGFVSKLDIDEISLDKVKSKIDLVLNN